MTNGGGIRGGKIYPPGTTLTRRDVLAELPFGNRLVTIDISGGELAAAIENGLSQLPTAGGRFPQVSGLTIEADPSRPAGHRVLSITVGDAPLDDQQDLFGCDQRLHGARRRRLRACFRAAKPLLPPNDSPLMTNEVMDYIEHLGTVRTGVDGRIVLK